MNGLFQIIQFAAESRGNLLTTCAVVLVFGIALAIPFSTMNSVVNIKHAHVHEPAKNKEENN